MQMHTRTHTHTDRHTCSRFILCTHNHLKHCSSHRLIFFLSFFLCFFCSSSLPVKASLPLHVLVVQIDGCMVTAATESYSHGECVVFIWHSAINPLFFMFILDLEYARNFCKFSQKIVLVKTIKIKSIHLFIWKKINLNSYHLKKWIHHDVCLFLGVIYMSW